MVSSGANIMLEGNQNVLQHQCQHYKSLAYSVPCEYSLVISYSRVVTVCVRCVELSAHVL